MDHTSTQSHRTCTSEPPAAAGLTRWVWVLTPFAALMLVGTVLWQPFYGGPRPAFWLSVVAGTLLLAASWRRVKTLATRRLVVVWLCLWLPVMLSWPASIEPVGTAKVALVLTLALPAGCLWVLALQDEAWRTRIEWALTGVLLFWTCDGLLQWLVGVDLLGVPLRVDGRVNGLFTDHLRMSVFLGLLSPIVFFRMHQWRPTVAIVATLAVLFVSTLAGTRTQLLVAALVMLGLLPVLGWRLRIVLAGTLALALTVVVVFSTLHGAKFKQTLGQESGLVPHEQIPGKPAWFSSWDYRLTFRLRSWSAATAMGLQNPTGVGASAFREAYPAYTFPGDWRIKAPKGTEINHAHHVWFALFGEEGFPGVAGLLLAMAAATRWWRSGSTSDRRKAAPYAVALAVYLFPLNTSHPMYLFWLFPVLWVLACGFVAAVTPYNFTQDADAP